MISLILFAITAVIFGLRELAYHGKLRFKGKFFNQKAWWNKYKFPVEPAPDNWYYKLFKITYRERWPGSATIFVTFTDFLHAAQFMIKLLLIACIVFYRPIFGLWDPLIMWVGWGVFFSITYRIAAE